MPWLVSWALMCVTSLGQGLCRGQTRIPTVKSAVAPRSLPVAAATSCLPKDTAGASVDASNKHTHISQLAH